MKQENNTIMRTAKHMPPTCIKSHLVIVVIRSKCNDRYLNIGPKQFLITVTNVIILKKVKVLFLVI